MIETDIEDSEDVERLLGFLRDTRGFDFTGYKRSSLTRRIRKRMQDVGVDDYVDYQDLLETNADEFNALFNTILINVTSFFRDASAWQFLQREILPDIVSVAETAEEIRIWSAGAPAVRRPIHSRSASPSCWAYRTASSG